MAPEPKEAKDATDKVDSSKSFSEKLSELSPHIQKAMDSAKPMLKAIEPMLHAAYPHFVVIKDHALKGYYVVQPYYDEEVGSIVLALVLLFLGGHFAMTIACWQVFRVSGARLVGKSWRELCESFQEAVVVLQKDPEAKAIFDKNKDGVITPSELLVGFKDLAIASTDEEKKHSRKKVLLLMKCIDPTKIWDATLGVWTGIVAVLATLRSRFVQSITIGATVGQKVVDVMMPLVQPKLYEAFPSHQKWVDFCLRAGGGIIGALISLVLIRVISAFNSALEGANLLVPCCMRIAERKGLLGSFKPSLEQSRGAIWVVAVVGFLAQFRSGFSLPLLIRIPLMPVLTVEWFLMLISARPI